MEPGQPSRHILVFEPRVEGHHLTYLRYITDDLLEGGFQVSLALDGRPAPRGKIQEAMGSLLEKLNVLSVYDAKGQMPGGKLAALTRCQKQVNADFVFLTSLDEVASSLFRRAAFGKYPDPSLRGRMGGIYFRPRMLLPGAWSPNHWLKKKGFHRMIGQDWFRQILLCDEFLCAEMKREKSNAPLHFLPDPYPDDFLFSQLEARRKLDLPLEKKIFLFYGGSYRRKGLHVAVEAMFHLAAGTPAFLLCAGQQPGDAATTSLLGKLAEQKRAGVLNRYVSDEEEKLCFAAADVILLPYLKHFGSSGVLARAAGAHKPVIASDEELIGRRVREHRLGLVFPSGNARALGQCLERAARWSEAEVNEKRESIATYAQTCSRQKFREVLLQSF